MKKIFALMFALVATAFAVEAKPKEIKLIEDAPRQALKSSKASLVIDGNDILIKPNKNEKHTRFTIDKNFDFTDYKAMSFTLENLDKKPVRVSLFITQFEQVVHMVFVSHQATAMVCLLLEKEYA